MLSLNSKISREGKSWQLKENEWFHDKCKERGKMYILGQIGI